MLDHARTQNLMALSLPYERPTIDSIHLQFRLNLKRQCHSWVVACETIAIVVVGHVATKIWVLCRLIFEGNDGDIAAKYSTQSSVASVIPVDTSYRVRRSWRRINRRLNVQQVVSTSLILSPPTFSSFLRHCIDFVPRNFHKYSMLLLGVFGTCPQENFKNRCSEIASDSIFVTYLLANNINVFVNNIILLASQ